MGCIDITYHWDGGQMPLKDYAVRWHYENNRWRLFVATYIQVCRN